MALQDEEARKQIHQMRNFILNEARDKAQEIEAKTLEDFNLEKLKLVQQMKNKVREEYQQKAKKIETERAIARSVMTNKYRLQKLEARRALLNDVEAVTQAQLVKLLENKEKHKQILINLIVQDHQVVICRQQDEKLVQEALAPAAKLYSEIIKNETKADKSVTFVIDKDNHLSPGAANKDSVNFCSGGVKVATKNGKTIVDNTIDARLNLAMQQCMPKIRSMLFPANA